MANVCERGHLGGLLPSSLPSSRPLLLLTEAIFLPIPHTGETAKEKGGRERGRERCS